MGWQPIDTAPRGPTDLHPWAGPTLLLATKGRGRFLGYWWQEPGKKGEWRDTSTHRECYGVPAYWAPVIDPPPMDGDL